MTEKEVEFRNVRQGWLKFMYFYTIVGAGGFGLGILFIPEVIQSAFGFPAQDPVVLGIVGSVYAAFGLLSIPGLRSPMNFVPILLLQLCYKVIWVGIIAAPLLFSSGRFPFHAVVLLVIFATYIIGDIIAIPFSSILSKGIITASRRDLRC
jgi:hypothetical protein